MTLLFNADQWAELLDRRRTVTIRRGMRKVLPGPQLAACNGDMAILHVKEVAFRFFKDLDLNHAVDTGHTTAFALKQALSDTYPGLQDLEIVTIINIDEVLLHHDTNPHADER